MPRQTFEISFDRHGHILVEDAELARRILYLLRHDHKLVVHLVSDQPDPDSGGMPNLAPCLFPEEGTLGDRPIRNGRLCPNVMCDCGALKLTIDDGSGDPFPAPGEHLGGI